VPALPGELAPELPLASPALLLPELPVEPALPLEPPALELLDPALPPPPLELLELELLLELEPLAPPELGDDAPELEGEEGGVGTEGVVGVLAEGHPANSSNTPTNPIASRGRYRASSKRDARFIAVAVPYLGCWVTPDQKTTQSYQSPQVHPLHSAA
jgi:hypothetical protein